MKILVSPSGFKESLEADVAADCIEEGILRVIPNAIVRKAPLVDGGEGFTRALVQATKGQLKFLEVVGPVQSPIQSFYGFLGGGSKTAVIEMAAAAGLRLVPRDARDPGSTTTYGVGQLILAALDDGAEHIILGCGDSGTCDGGAGMVQALGGRLLDIHGAELPRSGGGNNLFKLHDIDLTGLDPRLRNVNIEVACNWHNVLCGPKGVARVFGPQKGATPDQVETLAAGLETYARIVERILGYDISTAPGSGASGGLGAGLMVVGATLHPRFDVIMKYFCIDDLMDDCDLVITAEGGIDYQTPRGKIPAEVARRAKQKKLPVIALAGTVGVDADVNYLCPTSLENAIDQAERLLKDGAESAMRMVVVGRGLNEENRMADMAAFSAKLFGEKLVKPLLRVNTT
ncbi:glycerate kinase family protein [Cadophora sp. MPI-SDFR-AT-0126]|nr:glycerate kinase family protein [Leotiomycetes sp. MPI-SDFR-AT-0126]